MNTTTLNQNTSLENRLRQIAVLVASVDTAAARQVLMQLPTEIAKRVRAMAADIGPIPPEERRALLVEFQKSQAQLRSKGSAATDGSAMQPAEVQPSTAQAFADFASNHSQSATPVQLQGPAWTRLGVEALVKLVKSERPTVISVVLQQLPAAQAAAVLQRLSRSTAKNVLHTLGNMQEIDEEARRTIDEHLSEKLRDYHHKMESELEQSRRMNELLSAAPPELRQQWASWMQPDVFLEPSDADAGFAASATASAIDSLDRLYQSAYPTEPVVVPLNDSISVRNDREELTRAASQSGSVNYGITSADSTANGSSVSNPAGKSLHEKLATNLNKGQEDTASMHSSQEGSAARTVRLAAETAVMTPAERKYLQQRMDGLLKMHPEDLAQLLSTLDSSTILLALAGASPKFMKRFNQMLEPEDAIALGERIKRVGSVTLREIDRAQQKLVGAYSSRLLDEGRSSDASQSESVSQARRKAA